MGQPPSEHWAEIPPSVHARKRYQLENTSVCVRPCAQWVAEIRGPRGLSLPLSVGSVGFRCPSVANYADISSFSITHVSKIFTCRIGLTCAASRAHYGGQRAVIRSRSLSWRFLSAGRARHVLSNGLGKCRRPRRGAPHMTQGASIDRDMIDAADQALDRVALVAAAIPALCTEDIEGACCGASCVLLDALEELRASVRAVDGGPEE